MREVSPVEKLAELREMVALLAASPREQAAWLAAESFPVDEMYLQFDDAVPAWFNRLELAGLLTPGIRDSADNLLRQLESMKDKSLWAGSESLFREDWSAVRQLAERALSEIDAALMWSGN